MEIYQKWIFFLRLYYFERWIFFKNDIIFKDFFLKMEKKLKDRFYLKMEKFFKYGIFKYGFFKDGNFLKIILYLKIDFILRMHSPFSLNHSSFLLIYYLFL